MRNGPNGPERIYLVPVLLPEDDASSPNHRVIRGKLLEDGAPVPEEFYTFLAYSANVHIYITDLYTNTVFDGLLSFVNVMNIVAYVLVIVWLSRIMIKGTVK